TEVGYVGRDVESIIRDLTEVAVQMVREEKTADIRERARARVEQRLVELLQPSFTDADLEEARGRLRQMLRGGRRQDVPVVRDRHRQGRRGDGHQRQGDAPGPLRREEETPQDDGPGRPR